MHVWDRMDDMRYVSLFKWPGQAGQRWQLIHVECYYRVEFPVWYLVTHQSAIRLVLL